MVRYLALAGTVHEAADACDYLVDRTGVDDDVRVVSWGENRDLQDVLNVFRARLPGVRVEAREAEDGTATRILDEARAFDADVIVGVKRAGPESPDTGRIIEHLPAEAERPVVVLPVD